jgi:glycosyltransferase involved in cell wall biosynthesis
MPDATPFVSIVVPTYNRNDLLCRTIECLLKQDYPTYELIVVDQTRTHDRSTKEFLDEAKQRIKYFFLERPNVSAARNFGFQQSRGDIILYFDDDMEVPTDVLRRVTKRFEDERVDGLTIKIIEGEAALPASTGSRLLKARLFGGQFMSFRRRVFEAIGGFDEWFAAQPVPSGEDSDFTYRAVRHGFRLWLDEGIVVRHCGKQASGGCERYRLQANSDTSDADVLSGLVIIWKNKSPGPLGAANAFWRGYHAYALNLAVVRSGLRGLRAKNARFFRLFRQVLGKPWLLP